MAAPPPATSTLTAEGFQLDTRSRILLAAVDVFGARGYEATSIREITDRVGVSPGLVKYHFTNKRILLQEAVLYYYGRASQAMTLSEEEFADLSPRDQARLEIRRSITFYAQNPSHLRIAMSEIIDDGDRLQWIAENFMKTATARALARTKEHIANGVYPDIGPLHMYYAFVGMTRWMFMVAPEVRRNFGIDPTMTEIVEKHIEAVTVLLLGPADSTNKR